jgi:hypothetical protein
MARVLTAVAIGVLALGGRHAWRHLKYQKKNRLPGAKLEVWEGEGGSVPVARDRTAAQVSPDQSSPRTDKS